MTTTIQYNGTCVKRLYKTMLFKSVVAQIRYVMQKSVCSFVHYFLFLLLPPHMGISGLCLVFLSSFIFVVTHIHLRWLATTWRTWYRHSPIPPRGASCLHVKARIMYYDHSSHRSMWGYNYHMIFRHFKQADTLLLCGFRENKASQKYFRHDRRVNPDPPR